MSPVKTVIPYKPDNPKSRLSPVFSEDERKQFVELSLENVLTALSATGMRRIDILCKSPLEPENEKRLRSLFRGETPEPVIFVDERDLNTAINDYLKKSESPVLIVMADLALITAAEISAMTAPPNRELPENDRFVRIAPGKDGGTNMMYIGAPTIFEVNYYGESFKKHKEEAKRKNLVCETYDSVLAAADMDEPEDLKDILVRGKGRI